MESISLQNSPMRRPSLPSQMGQQHRQLFCFAAPLKDGGPATFHYNFWTPPAFRPWPVGIRLRIGLVSIRRSTKGIRPHGRSDRLWCPPRKAISPAVHLFPLVHRSPEPDPFPWGKSQKTAVTGPAATKLYSPRPCTRRPSRHICVNCHAPGMRGRQPGPSGFILTQ